MPGAVPVCRHTTTSQLKTLSDCSSDVPTNSVLLTRYQHSWWKQLARPWRLYWLNWSTLHNGHFCCFDCLLTIFDCFLTIGTPLVHCWYSLGRPVTIGTPIVLSVLTIGLVYHSSKTVKRVKIANIIIGVPNYQSSHVYQDCTNSVPFVKNSQKTVKQQKNDHWCTNRHISTQSPTQPPTLSGMGNE